MKEYTLRIVREFSELPTTEEKININNRYLNDEISHIQFFFEAERYLQKVNAIAQEGE